MMVSTPQLFIAAMLAVSALASPITKRDKVIHDNLPSLSIRDSFKLHPASSSTSSAVEPTVSHTHHISPSDDLYEEADPELEVEVEEVDG